MLFYYFANKNVMGNSILEQVKETYGYYKGEPIEKISIGLGINPDNSYCIYDLETKRIMHNGLLKEDVDAYMEYARKLTK